MIREEHVMGVAVACLCIVMLAVAFFLVRAALLLP